MVRIALYDPEEKTLNFYCRTCHSIVWLGKILIKYQMTYTWAERYLQVKTIGQYIMI